MGRKRTSASTKGLPANLYRRVVKGRAYFSYRDIDGNETGMGSDRSAAIEAAGILNAARTTDPVTQLINRVSKPKCTVSQHSNWYKEEHLPGRRIKKTGLPLSAGTIKNHHEIIDPFEREFSSKDVATLTRQDIHSYLSPIPPAHRNRTLQILKKFFLLAAERGFRDDNPCDLISKADESFKRQRLKKAAYDEIYAAAEPWMQRAMRLALLSLQRPDDLCKMNSDCWDGDKWWVEQSKSSSQGYGRLVITPHPELRDALNDCLNNIITGQPSKKRVPSAIPKCPYLLTWEPRRIRQAKNRDHVNQLSAELLQDEFVRTYTALNLFSDIPNEKLKPSFYEIKALGGLLYEEAGRSTAWISKLMGHQEEKTTQIYLDRHKIKWVAIEL